VLYDGYGARAPSRLVEERVRELLASLQSYRRDSA